VVLPAKSVNSKAKIISVAEYLEQSRLQEGGPRLAVTVMARRSSTNKVLVQPTPDAGGTVDRQVKEARKVRATSDATAITQETTRKRAAESDEEKGSHPLPPTTTEERPKSPSY